MIEYISNESALLLRNYWRARALIEWFENHWPFWFHSLMLQQPQHPWKSLEVKVAGQSGRKRTPRFQLGFMHQGEPSKSENPRSFQVAHASEVMTRSGRSSRAGPRIDDNNLAPRPLPTPQTWPAWSNQNLLVPDLSPWTSMNYGIQTRTPSWHNQRPAARSLAYSIQAIFSPKLHAILQYLVVDWCLGLANRNNLFILRPNLTRMASLSFWKRSSSPMIEVCCDHAIQMHWNMRSFCQ